MSNTRETRDRRDAPDVPAPGEPLPAIEPEAIHPVDPNFVTDDEGVVSHVSGRSVVDDETEDDETRRRRGRSE